MSSPSLCSCSKDDVVEVEREISDDMKQDICPKVKVLKWDLLPSYPPEEADTITMLWKDVKSLKKKCNDFRRDLANPENNDMWEMYQYQYDSWRITGDDLDSPAMKKVSEGVFNRVILVMTINRVLIGLKFKKLILNGKGLWLINRKEMEWLSKLLFRWYGDKHMSKASDAMRHEINCGDNDFNFNKGARKFINEYLPDNTKKWLVEIKKDFPKLEEAPTGRKGPLFVMKKSDEDDAFAAKIKLIPGLKIPSNCEKDDLEDDGEEEEME